MKKIERASLRFMGRTYIRFQARIKSIKSITSKIIDSCDLVEKHMANLTEAQVTFKPKPDVWSAGEVIHHVAKSSKGMIRIAETLHSNQAMPRRMEDSDIGRAKAGVSLKELKTEWMVMREEIARKLETFQKPLKLKLTYRHPWFGELNAKEWLVLNYIHGGIHLRQLKRIEASKGYPN